MRSFTSFLNRRRVNDIHSWLSGNGIKTLEQLALFCERQELSFDKEECEKYFQTDTKPVSAPKKTAKDSWHTPAAERPIKKTTTRRRRTTKKKPKEE